MKERHSIDKLPCGFPFRQDVPQDFSTFSVLYIFQALAELKEAPSHKTAGMISYIIETKSQPCVDILIKLNYRTVIFLLVKLSLALRHK